MMRRDWCRACVTSWWQPNCLLSTFTQTVSHTQRRRTHNDEWHMTMTVTVACVLVAITDASGGCWWLEGAGGGGGGGG